MRQKTKCLIFNTVGYSGLQIKNIQGGTILSQGSKNILNIIKSILTFLHDQNKSGFFEGPAFIQPIRKIFITP